MHEEVRSSNTSGPIFFQHTDINPNDEYNTSNALTNITGGKSENSTTSSSLSFSIADCEGKHIYK